MKNILISICVRRFGIVIRYFLFENNAFNLLLEVIGIQIMFSKWIKKIYKTNIVIRYFLFENNAFDLF